MGSQTACGSAFVDQFSAVFHLSMSYSPVVKDITGKRFSLYLRFQYSTYVWHWRHAFITVTKG